MKGMAHFGEPGPTAASASAAIECRSAFRRESFALAFDFAFGKEVIRA